MDKKLVYSIEEEKLSKEIFDLYMNSDSRSDYSSKLKNKSHECGKTGTYLRGLRELYIERYASETEKKAYSLKKSSMNPKTFSFVKLPSIITLELFNP